MAGIFKSYDVRGTVPDQLTTGEAYKIGKATAAYLKAKTLVVGRDARISSPALQAALMAGITSTGCDVLDIGEGPTPISYYAAGTLGAERCQGAIQVTASHNPPQYGGFKFTKADAYPMSYGQGLEEVEKLFRQDQPGPAGKAGQIAAHDIFQGYLNHCLSFANLKKDRVLKVAIDCGNGVIGGRYLPELLKDLPLDVLRLYWEPDGNFPNHEANPLKVENIEELCKLVVAEKCDLGIAFDGDGDRCAFVDETGEPVPGDLAGTLMALSLLEKEPGGVVLYDVRATKALAKAVEETGGKAIETRVGHSHIKAGLRANQALMAAELSGHYYFRDFFHSDSGEAAMFLVLNQVSQSGKKLSELVSPLKRFFHTGEINFEVEDRDRTLALLEGEFAAEAKSVSHVDGISFDMGDWWFNVRPSNTEPVIRLNLESLVSRAQMEEKQARVSQAIHGA
jgi:phosphomannomutase